MEVPKTGRLSQAEGGAQTRMFAQTKDSRALDIVSNARGEYGNACFDAISSSRTEAPSGKALKLPSTAYLLEGAPRAWEVRSLTLRHSCCSWLCSNVVQQLSNSSLSLLELSIVDLGFCVLCCCMSWYSIVKYSIVSYSIVWYSIV